MGGLILDDANDISYEDLIAQFKDNEWSQYGKLLKARSAHASITVGLNTMVIGGDDQFSPSGR